VRGQRRHRHLAKNTWDIVDELNLRRNFVPRSAFRFLERGKTYTTKMVNPGWIGTFWQNLFSGVAPAPDVFVFMYSLVDLLSTPIHRDDFLDLYSVNAFMRSRPYATERAAQLQQRVWETVWAIPSYDASLRTYKTFLKYGNYDLVPQLWLLNQNKYDGLIKPIEDKLKSYGPKFKLELLVRAKKLDVDATTGRVTGLHYARLNRSPALYDEVEEVSQHHQKIEGDLILAVTPGGLRSLVNDEVYNRDPSLGNVR
jgi:zeta-carotene desaturase